MVVTMQFSQKYGHKPIKDVVQLDKMDEDLRNSLWNAFNIYFVGGALKGSDTYAVGRTNLLTLISTLWLDYFKLPLDTISENMYANYTALKDYFFECKWYEAYDFIEFAVNNYKDESQNKRFMEYCNSILERETSGYRFVGGRISPVTAKEEITEIEEALKPTESLSHVVAQLRKALDLMSDRKSPDYENCIKESISAVEAICRLIVGNDKATLGKALNEIECKSKIRIHPDLKKAFVVLYGYTSDEGGIRHALRGESNVYFEEAKFMLVACAAFINYLKLKSSQAGIEL